MAREQRKEAKPRHQRRHPKPQPRGATRAHLATARTRAELDTSDSQPCPLPAPSSTFFPWGIGREDTHTLANERLPSYTTYANNTLTNKRRKGDQKRKQSKMWRDGLAIFIHGAGPAASSPYKRGNVHGTSRPGPPNSSWRVRPIQRARCMLTPTVYNLSNGMGRRKQPYPAWGASYLFSIKNNTMLRRRRDGAPP